MTELEKVIAGLERFIDDFKPFCGNRDDWQRVYDALALLKAQVPRVMKTASEPLEPVLYTTEDKTIWSSWYICGACQNPVECWDKFCRNCGRPIKWEGSEADDET